MIMLDVNFVPNSADDLHCQQSAYAMIRDYYEPGKYSYSWDEWAALTGYEADKGTWASTSLLWFVDRGYSVQHISLFDYSAFVKDGSKYLIETYGEDVGNWQVEHSNLPKEQKLARILLEKGIITKQEPQINDIKIALDTGALIRCLVNSCVLAYQDGYTGHAVVLTGYDGTGFIIQDPGLPPLPNRHVAYELFNSSWAYPNNQAKEMDIIKK